MRRGTRRGPTVKRMALRLQKISVGKETSRPNQRVVRRDADHFGSWSKAVVIV